MKNHLSPCNDKCVSSQLAVRLSLAKTNISFLLETTYLFQSLHGNTLALKFTLLYQFGVPSRKFC